MRLNLILFITLLVNSCNLAPKYQRPKVDIVSEKESNIEIKIKWRDFYQSKDLQNIIDLTIQNNKDIKNLSLNLEIFKQNKNIATSNLIPWLNANASLTKQQPPAAFASFTPSEIYRANIVTSNYELDLFGKLRNARKSALENYLAQNYNKIVIQNNLLSEVIVSYINVALYKKLISLNQEIISYTNEKLNITSNYYNNGRATKTDLNNIKSILESYKIANSNYQNIVNQNQSIIMAITGKFDEEIYENINLDDIKINDKLFNSRESISLLDRPDIIKAEHELKSANANIGIARAAFFPSISLTGNYGLISISLSELINNKSWSFAPSINLPIFNAGSNLFNLKITKAQKEIMINNYKKTIEEAFSETLEYLSERKIIDEKISSAANNVLSARENKNINYSQFNYGRSNKFSYLDAKINEKQAQIILNEFRALKLVNSVNLYKIFGYNYEDK